MALRSRLRPWHGLMIAVFAVGVTVSTVRNDALAHAPYSLLVPTIEGLLAVVVFQFTVGNVWGYVVSYREAGGGWTDLPFLVPFAAGVGAFLAVVASMGGLAAAAGAAFWAFVLVAGVVALATWVAVGYREGRGGPA